MCNNEQSVNFKRIIMCDTHVQYKLNYEVFTVGTRMNEV